MKTQQQLIMNTPDNRLEEIDGLTEEEIKEMIPRLTQELERIRESIKIMKQELIFWLMVLLLTTAAVLIIGEISGLARGVIYN